MEMLGGPKIKSPGNVMNCPENPKKIQNAVGGGSFRGSKNQKSWKCHELPRKSKKVKPRWGVGWGGGFRGQHFMNCRENR